MKCTDLWKHHQLQRCLTYSKGDRTACQAFGIGELRFGGKQLMVGCGYAGIELLALWGQGDTAIGTDEECTAKRVLQILIAREMFGSLFIRIAAARVKL